MIVLGVDVGIRVCGYVICRVCNLDIEILKEEEIKVTMGLIFLKVKVKWKRKW